MKIKWNQCLGNIALPLFVGGLAALLTRDSMQVFAELNKPPLSPPGWLFPIVWTILYAMMGIASCLIRASGAPSADIQKALKLYYWQLLINFFWSIWFFRLELYGFSFFWLLILWVFILLTMRSFSRISKQAACLLVPYLVWVTFAGYLNFGIALLN